LDRLSLLSFELFIIGFSLIELVWLERKCHWLRCFVLCFLEPDCWFSEPRRQHSRFIIWFLLYHMRFTVCQNCLPDSHCESFPRGNGRDRISPPALAFLSVLFAVFEIDINFPAMKMTICLLPFIIMLF
jgi:hypothetical protein